ncbi:hypothetical protein ACHAWU_001715 [Discostella pseudostelligera]|uniref:Uncharacterized protein n=1 Tax=Discostella pseudostelligera TaxID=259834 RepID=A0ABD3M806_9STRA
MSTNTAATEKQKQKRQHRQTQQQKDTQAQWYRETMVNKRVKKLADKMESERAKHANNKLNFFSAHNQRKITHDAVNDGSANEAMADITVTGLIGIVQEEEDVLVVNNPTMCSGIVQIKHLCRAAQTASRTIKSAHTASGAIILVEW